MRIIASFRRLLYGAKLIFLGGCRMLEDQSFHDVVSWGPHGDCFVVKDMNEFTKSILPRMFKHSNFASFVRQLNKYDFHKVRSAFPLFFSSSFSSCKQPCIEVSRPLALSLSPTHYFHSYFYLLSHIRRKLRRHPFCPLHPRPRPCVRPPISPPSYPLSSITSFLPSFLPWM